MLCGRSDDHPFHLGMQAGAIMEYREMNVSNYLQILCIFYEFWRIQWLVFNYYASHKKCANFFWALNMYFVHLHSSVGKKIMLRWVYRPIRYSAHDTVRLLVRRLLLLFRFNP